MWSRGVERCHTANAARAERGDLGGTLGLVLEVYVKLVSDAVFTFEEQGCAEASEFSMRDDGCKV